MDASLLALLLAEKGQQLAKLKTNVLIWERQQAKMFITCSSFNCPYSRNLLSKVSTEAAVFLNTTDLLRCFL